MTFHDSGCKRALTTPFVMDTSVLFFGETAFGASVDYSKFATAFGADLLFTAFRSL